MKKRVRLSLQFVQLVNTALSSRQEIMTHWIAQQVRSLTLLVSLIRLIVRRALLASTMSLPESLQKRVESTAL